MHSTIIAHWQAGVWVTGKDFDSGVMVLVLKEFNVQSTGLCACTITVLKYPASRTVHMCC
jgi:hypothetical protein